LRWLCLLLACLLYACDDPKEGLLGSDDKAAIGLVAEGSVETHPGKPIGAAADCYFDSTAWSSFLGADGHTYVNLEGLGIAGQQSRTIIQFRVFRADPSFSLVAADQDGVGQPDAAVIALVNDMFACQVDD
jgi:hypothetical protein